MVSSARRPATFQKAQRECAQNAKVLQRHVNKVWNSAADAPMFRKEIQKMKKVPTGSQGGTKLVPVKDKDGRPVMARRSVRLVQGHAYNIAIAGGVKAAIRELKKDCDTWGIDYPESTKQPFMLGMPKGSKLMIEQFLSAYVSTGVLHASRMMNEMGKHKRLNKDYIKRAFGQLNEAMQSNTGTSRASCIVPLKVKKAAAAGKDYEDTGDPDAAKDAAAAAGDA